MSEQKITPLLMFNGEATQAMRFYTSIFKGFKIESVFHQDTGEVLHGKFTMNGQTFMAMDNSNGTQIDPTPSMSLFVTCKTEEEINYVFQKLSEDGTILIDLAETSFAVKFAWITDRFGISWQLQLEKSE